ncbi:MAG: hypothetical protein M3P51_16290 [Chloroflexota bacterium]|nr:hypothetical protein [Chloroflexota bacterium]
MAMNIGTSGSGVAVGVGRGRGVLVGFGRGALATRCFEDGAALGAVGGGEDVGAVVGADGACVGAMVGFGAAVSVGVMGSDCTAVGDGSATGDEPDSRATG